MATEWNLVIHRRAQGQRGACRRPSSLLRRNRYRAEILLAATPSTGHLNPLLAIARMALARGDEALVAAATSLRTSVEASGARFQPLAPGADIDLTRVEEILPERASLPPGPEQLRYNFERIFLDTLHQVDRGLRRRRPLAVGECHAGSSALRQELAVRRQCLRLARTLSMRRPSMSTTSKRHPPASKASPTPGIRPSWKMT